MCYFVYVLYSKESQKTYVGITNNVERRLNQHNYGYHLYTRRYLPWKVIYTEEYNDRKTARSKEKYLKSAAGRKWLSKNLF